MSPPSRGETPASIVTTKITHATLFNILFPAITSPFNKELDGPAVVKNDARILSRSLSKCRTIVNARAGRLAKTRQEVLAPAPRPGYPEDQSVVHPFELLALDIFALPPRGQVDCGIDGCRRLPLD